VTQEWLDLVLQRDELADLDVAARRLAIRALVAERADPNEVGPLVTELSDVVDGYGRLAPLMRDPEITDILVNGPREVWIEREGGLERSDVCFTGERELGAFIERLLGGAGRRVDATEPVADARLDDGARMHVVLPPLAPAGPLVSIRRWPQGVLTLHDLVGRGMLEEPQAQRLISCVRDRVTVAVTGGTGAGKTTLLNALLAYVPEDERVVLIEETPELHPACPHAVSLVARPANIEGRGEIGPAALVRTALRMRPDRIVVGEVRGPEALAALAAMSTGHEGSMVTLHARSAEDALERMVTLALSAGSGLAEESLRRQVINAFGVVVHLERCSGGRRVVEIAG